MDKYGDMSCQELVELVTDYIEGGLTPQDRLRFETHLAACPWCVDYLDQVRITIATLGKLTEDSISPEAKQQLLHVFHNWKSS